MMKTIDFASGRGRRVLEVGFGQGSDLLTWAEHGAEVSGIDITGQHFHLASENFRLRGLSANLKLCDAASIAFPSQHFDVVYSHGVLHHTPDIRRCIAECHRVLRPGGTLILSLYHTYSVFHAWTLLRGILTGKIFKLGYRGLMSTIERGPDGVSVRPLVLTYSRREVRDLLQDFEEVVLQVAHLSATIPGQLRRLMPAAILDYLEGKVGWYVIATARKRT